MKAYNIIANVEIAETASGLMEAKAGDSAKGLLCIPLVPIDSTTDASPTHLAGSGPIGDEMVALLFDPQALSEATQISLEEATYLLSQAHISSLEDESFDAACQRLGLEKQRIAL
jgi:hypothetical protein